MGLLSLFRKRSPEQIKQEIIGKIVVSSLSFRGTLKDYDNQRSAAAGAEMLMLLLHLLDRVAFGVLGESSRNAIWDEITRKSCIDYHKAVLSGNAPPELFELNVRKTFKEIDDRQRVYSQCGSLLGEGFPSKGTVLFAFSHFVHRALGETNRSDVEGVLIGRSDVTTSNANAFPAFDVIIANATWVGAIIKKIGFEADLKKLA